MPEVSVGNLPFEEAIEFFQDKLLIPSDKWDDLVGPIHAKAFTVAGATKLQLVQDLYQAVQNSILDGTTITQFRKDFDSIVAKHGWSYKGKRGWRTSVIFRTNKRSSYMAGHWAQFQRLKEQRPYLMYLTVGDERVRDSHKKWHRRVAHIDDPIWKQIFPPNGWLCRCFVRSLSKADLDEMGITAERIGKVELVDFTDPKTGEILKQTPGVDIGWDYNVGQSWLAPEVLLGQQLMDIPAEMRAKALKWFDNDIYDKPFSELTNKLAYQLAKGKSATKGESQTVGFCLNLLLMRSTIEGSFQLV
jgi:SPP1 gp7 family putative phage head morphogenesis protein